MWTSLVSTAGKTVEVSPAGAESSVETTVVAGMVMMDSPAETKDGVGRLRISWSSFCPFVLDRVPSAGGEVYSSWTVYLFSSPFLLFGSWVETGTELVGRPLPFREALLVLVLASSSSVLLLRGSPRISPSLVTVSETVSTSPGAEDDTAMGAETGSRVSRMVG